MDYLKVFSIENVLLARRGHYISGTLILSRFHMVFSFQQEKPTDKPREIWICYPIIDKLTKARGSSWANAVLSSSSGPQLPPPPAPQFGDFDKYTSSNIKVHCKDFTYYSFDFSNDLICTDVFIRLSALVTAPKVKGVKEFYAYDYRPNVLESRLESTGWALYDPVKEYKRQKLLVEDDESAWRLSRINDGYRFCPSYPESFIVPASISDSVLKHAGKFRSKQRVPAVVYKHRQSKNGNVIARCSQPLVGLNLQNRSIQDEKLIEEIFKSQKYDRANVIDQDSEYQDQPQRNLIVDLRPITNAMAQHALGAGTENIDNYRGRSNSEGQNSSGQKENKSHGFQQVDKIFCNIDNIHVMRDSLNKLTSILSDLDRYPVSTGNQSSPYPLLPQALTKTQWLHRLSIILQSVDRITKSVHLNNTNVLIHCSDGWDRTSQVSALAQLCLDPYYRTIEGFIVLIEKEWLSFGFKFATRGDHGGCTGALVPIVQKETKQDSTSADSETLSSSVLSSSQASLSASGTSNGSGINGASAKAAVSSFLQRAATHIKNTAQAAASSASEVSSEQGSFNTYGTSSEKSPIFHQFLDCAFQIFRQHPTKFEFNSRFLKRLFYHYYSCQYGTFLCNSEKQLKVDEKVSSHTVSVWDYFLSRPNEFINKSYEKLDDDEVLFFNYSEVKWWHELYGRSDEEMNGLSNSLDRKFAQLKINYASGASPSPAVGNSPGSSTLTVGDDGKTESVAPTEDGGPAAAT